MRFLASLSLLVAFTLLSGALFAQGCTVRSGDPAVTVFATNGLTPFTPFDFAAAQGPPAVLVTPDPSWISALPCDPMARWIGVASNPSLSSGLYAVPFDCPRPTPCAVVASAKLDVCFAVDNLLGSESGGAVVNEGMFFNGVPLPNTTLLGNSGTASNYNTQHLFQCLDVTNLLLSGTNYLYLFNQNINFISGIIFSATLTITWATQSGALCEPVDNSWTVVPFLNSLAPEYRNDDQSSAAISLCFDFCFYGETYTEIFINNNGNVTLGAPLGTFTGACFPLPASQPPMIAPFWADVDTLNLSSGIVRYKKFPASGPVTRLVISWDCVGYYNQQVDKTNTFQLTLSNGQDSVVGIGENVCFCYGDMQWTTGSASGGVGGFGGSPAIVGINVGDGVNSTAVGKFDQAGIAYDGGAGLNDGVSWLDNRRICFDACGCGQCGVPGINDLTINDSYSGSYSGLTIFVPAGTIAQIKVTTLPGALISLLFSLECHCPGIYTPYGEFHLDVLTMGAIVDGCGVFGPPDIAGFTASGNWVLNLPIPAGVQFCGCLQAIICHPAGFYFTQAHRVCVG